ncbi:MAG: aroE [Osedax symbiont Rs1]|nr:MAG: aroE [Osedax symbiont Rs1]
MIIKDQTALDKYAVAGNPIAHSKSPSIHRLFAEQTGQKLVYSAECFPLDAFASSVADFIRTSGLGMNVTVPFKLQAWQLSDQLSLAAELAGAVNTLSFKDGVIFGDNTDGIGLVNDLSKNLKFNLQGKKVLIVGAGGAVRGVLQPIIAQRPSSITIVNRTVSKAWQLAEIFKELFDIKVLSFEELDSAYDLVINGTSASLSNQLPPLPACTIQPSTWLYDMMYGKGVTVFNQWGLENGAAQASDGLGMLVEQAAQSFKIWRGVSPNTKQVISKLRCELLDII